VPENLQSLSSSNDVVYGKKVFIDSNVILEGKDLKDLPWEEIDISGPILVLLLPTLLNEIDSKKRDGRLGVRARDFNRLVAPLASKIDLITIRDTNPRVDMALALCSKIQWDLYDDLDQNEGDSRLVAEALNIKNHTKEGLILISQDINPMILFRRHGLLTFHLPESWLAKMEQSPHEKEMAKLKRQVADYAKTEPEFAVVTSLPNEPVLVYQVLPLTGDEESKLETKILEVHPRPTQVSSQLNHSAFGGSYDHTLNNRYDNYKNKIVPAYLKRLHEKLEVLHGQIPFRFTLKNIGKVRAENMHVEVRCAHGWLSQRVFITGSFPNAPKAKNPLSPPYFPPIYRPDPPIGRHEVEVEVPVRSNKFSAQCAEFRQGQSWEFEGVLWLDPKVEKNTTVVLIVTASNCHGEFQEIIKVQKAIQNSGVFDLMDFDGKAKLHPHTYTMVKEDIEKQDWGIIEWDSMQDK
jgi:hypothetical protein